MPKLSSNSGRNAHRRNLPEGRRPGALGTTLEIWSQHWLAHNTVIFKTSNIATENSICGKIGQLS